RSLADDPHYRALLRDLPHGVLGYAYVRGDVAGQRLARLPGQVGTAVANAGIRFRTAAHPLQTVTNAYLRWRWGALWLTRRTIGIRLRSAGPPLARSARIRYVQVLAKPYAPNLVDEIPADASRVVDFVAPPAMFELRQHLPPRLVRMFPHVNPLDLASELDALVAGETALYTRPGGETTLVSSPPDSAGAEDALRTLGITFPHALIGGQLVVSTAASGIAAFRNGARKLSADPAFRAARIPALVTGLVYERGTLAEWLTSDGGDAVGAVRFNG
ncbi:MAG: hypothetical protein ABUS54_13175, partial [Actinomycetota bacterium]